MNTVDLFAENFLLQKEINPQPAQLSPSIKQL